MFCQYCGKENKDGAAYCAYCGKPLTEQGGGPQEKAADPGHLTRKEKRAAAKAAKKAQKREKKARRKAEKKAQKKAKWAAKSFGQKVGSVFLRLIAWLLLLAILAFGVAAGIVYFHIVDIPSLTYIMNRFGIESSRKVSPDPLKDNYIPNEESIQFDSEENVYYADNEIIVIFSSSATNGQIQEVVDFLQGESVGTVPNLNMYQIKIPGSHSLQDLNALAQDLMRNFNYVSYATYDSAIVDASDDITPGIPNDPWNGDVDQQDWTDSDVDGSNWWAEAVEAQGAWAYNDELSIINIGISDSSFDIGHEDLKNKCSFPNELLESRNEITPWWNDFDFNTWSVKDQTNYHGTHVAGIIGAEGNNKKGITGLVQNCNLLLAPLSINDQATQYLWWDTSIYANLSYLVTAGAKVINYSQGKTNFLTPSNMEFSEEFIEREGNLAAISVATLLDEGYDFIVVQSAGNGVGDENIAVDAIQNGWFASVTNDSITASNAISIKDVLDRIIIVGAARQNGDGYMCTYFSNYGSQVDICAPGWKVYSTIPGEVFYDFQFFGGYGEESGTSMAAPIVTGVCAMAWSANPLLTGADVKQIVCNNSKDIVASYPDTPNNDTYNMVNAKLAVEAALNYDKNASADGNKGQYDASDIPTGAVEFNGHYYYIYDVDTVKDYQSSVKYCTDRNGYLATITSQEENDFLYEYMKQCGYSSAYFGLSDETDEGVWKWNNGEQSAYTNWHAGEPNSENSNEDYALFYYKYSDGTWNDGDFGGGTVNGGTVFICEWGEYELEAELQGQGSMYTSSGEREIVLVLDTSGSMAGTPMEETKKAATNFIETTLKQDAGIGIVTYSSSATCVADFTVNEAALKDVVSSIHAGGNTNIDAGLSTAQSMLQGSNAKKKIIVLMSDGMPNEGREGDSLIAFADEIKSEGILIYTLGFFEDLGSEKSSAQYLMEQLASDGCHYEVANAEDLVFFFEDMADQINGTRYIYVRIACPVDVSVSYNGETLSSAEDNLSLRTDFGTLTFEENENASAANSDDRIKILRLKEGADYDIQIVGTGRGIMDYTIGFMDEDGEYSDLREFEDIKISKTTVIDTVATVSDETILNIDEDGDGKYDIRYRARENGYGEEIKSNIMLYISIGVGVVAVIMLILIVRKACKIIKKKAGK